MMQVQICLQLPSRKLMIKRRLIQPLSTPELARQAEDLRAHLSVFPNGHRGPSGDRLLAEMELELLKRGTEELTKT